MWTFGVVVIPPVLDDDLGLLQGFGVSRPPKDLRMAGGMSPEF